MAGKSTLDNVFHSFLVLVLAILLLIEEAESKGGKSKPPASSGSKSKITKVRDASTGQTRCYNEEMVQISCPHSTAAISGAVVGGILVVAIVLTILFIRMRARKKQRESLKACDRDVEGGDGQQTSGREKHGATGGRDSCDVPSFNSSSSTIVPPTVSFPVPEPARLSPSQEPLMNATATVEPLPVPATTPTRKINFAGRLQGVLNKAGK